MELNKMSEATMEKDNEGNVDLNDESSIPDADLVDSDDEDSNASDDTIAEFVGKSKESVKNLSELLSNLQDVVERIGMSLDEGLFQGFSKETRNTMMQDVLEDSREIEAVARVLFRNLKKVKRVNMSNDAKDTLILKFLTVKQNVEKSRTGA
jgi:hypothetical protein